MKYPHHCPRNPLAVSASVASPGHGDEDDQTFDDRADADGGAFVAAQSSLACPGPLGNPVRFSFGPREMS